MNKFLKWIMGNNDDDKFVEKIRKLEIKEDEILFITLKERISDEAIYMMGCHLKKLGLKKIFIDYGSIDKITVIKQEK